MSKGLQSLTNFMFECYNRELKKKLIPKGYKPLEQSKAFDVAFQKPCELNSLKIDKLC